MVVTKLIYIVSGLNGKIQNKSKEIKNKSNLIKIDQKRQISSKKSIDFDFLDQF